MLINRDKGWVTNPHEVLEGTCATCHAYTSCKRWLALKPNQGTLRSLRASPGAFTDLPYSECPKCGSRVYLRVKVLPLDGSGTPDSIPTEPVKPEYEF